MSVVRLLTRFLIYLSEMELYVILSLAELHAKLVIECDCSLTNIHHDRFGAINLARE